MSGLVRLSARAYGGMLLLYPSDLRREFGPEMHELFGEDLDDAWQSSGVAGVLRVWWCALCEFLRIAVPGLTENPAFVVPLVASAFNALSLGSMLAGVISHHPLPADGSLMDEIVAHVFLPALITALTTFVVVRTGKVTVTSLQLNVGTETCSKSAI